MPYPGGPASPLAHSSAADATPLPLPGEMGPEAMSAWFRAPRFRDEEVARPGPAVPGVALGLAVTVEGGDVLLVEAACLRGRGTLCTSPGRPGR